MDDAAFDAAESLAGLLPQWMMPVHPQVFRQNRFRIAQCAFDHDSRREALPIATFEENRCMRARSIGIELFIDTASKNVLTKRDRMICDIHAARETSDACPAA